MLCWKINIVNVKIKNNFLECQKEKRKRKKNLDATLLHMDGSQRQINGRKNHVVSNIILFLWHWISKI